ncbi:uncharacterized protein RCC_09300 [Ramularia collo-cygni]|uniref:Uncharacterized protein n=1 Tax=Ramularia collo-cygni TaxID=112498 RepID=A0A2D3V2J2_9PEZI|nr:uncharacterized protein RCC_09300 [Ramularia collo-cygni]CZT23586.1 uncharacterized protein RCC_09300 [Ramularia collo-cygni]
MAHHTASPLRALYRVFVLPALSQSATTTRARLIPTVHPSSSTTRPYSHTPLLSAKTRPAEQRRQKWDSEITSLRIYLIDPETNALPPTPVTRYDTLKTLDTRTHRLVQLSPDEPNNPSFIPVCKIISKKEAYISEQKKKLAAKEAKKVNARGSEAGMKTLELNWAIDTGDLAHRLEKLRGFLEEGRRVEVCFRGKKRGRKASLEECEKVLEQVREVAQGVDGVREKGLEGKIGGVASVEFFVKGGGGGAKGGGSKGREEDDDEEDDEHGDDGDDGDVVVEKR